jgi:hypothetical protein
LAGKHEPSSGGSFYLSLATAALRFVLVVAALALGVFVLSKAFPTDGAASPIGPSQPSSPAATETTSPPEVTTEPEEQVTHEPSEIRLQVLNGTDVAGLASDAAEVLEADGYDVATVDDAPSKPYAVTEIFFKRAFEADAGVLRDQYFQGAELQDTAPDAQVSITVILGEDYAGAQEAEA